MVSSDGDPRLTRRGTDPLALALFDLLRHCAEADRRRVLDALDAVETPASGERASFALSAIERFRSESPAAPSKRRYEAWRRSHPDRESIPSATFVANTFGSWAKAMDAAGVRPSVRHRAYRLRALGQPPSDQEVLEDLRRCARELGLSRLRFADYRRWARERERTGRATRPLIVSPNTFIARFGSFPSAVARAGLRPARCGPRGKSSEHTPKRLVECLREADRSRNPRRGSLTVEAYERWRANRIARAEAEDRWLAVPSASAIRDRFGGWPAALRAARLVSRERASGSARGRGQKMSEEQIAASLVDAARELGPELTYERYLRWRVRRVDDLARPRPPSRSLISRKAGSWRRAKAFALAALSQPDPERWLADRLRELGR